MHTAEQTDKKYFSYQWSALGIGLLTLGSFIFFTQVQDHQRIENQERDRLMKQA